MPPQGGGMEFNMKRLLSFLLIIALCMTVLVSCDFGFGDNDDDRSDKNNKTDKDNSAVKTYVYDYDDFSELEKSDSPADLDEKKWKSASKFDLAQQWNLDPMSSTVDKSPSGNVCKIENTSALAMSFDLSFAVKGTPSYLASYIYIDVALVDSNGNPIDEVASLPFNNLTSGQVFISGTIPAKETYYLAIQQSLGTVAVDKIPTTDYEKVTDYYYDYTEEAHDHNHYETDAYYDYSGDVKYEGSYSYDDAIKVEDITYIFNVGDKIEYGTGGSYIVIGGIGGSFGGNVEYVTGIYEYYTGNLEYYTGKIEFVTGDYENVIGGGSIIIGGINGGISGAITTTLGAQVYLNCASRKATAEEDSFGNQYDPTPDYGYDETYPDYDETSAGDYDFNMVDYEGRYETMYVNAPDGHQITVYDEYGNTMSVAHAAEVTRIGYGGYWSIIEIYGMKKFVQTEYLSYNIAYEETILPDIFESRHITVYPRYDLYVYNDADEYSTVLGEVFAYESVYVISENAMRGWYFIEFYDGYGNYKTGYILSNPDYYDFNYTEESTSPSVEFDRPWERGEVPYPNEVSYYEGYHTTNLRTDYNEFPLFDDSCNQVFTLYPGEEVTILGQSSDATGYWYYIVCKDKYGYIPTYFIN